MVKARRVVAVAVLIAVAGLVLGVLVRQQYRDVLCQGQLKAMGTCLWAYHNDYGMLPCKDKWYDLLIENRFAQAEHFACARAPRGQGRVGHYMMNEDINTEHTDAIEGDVVLLFDGPAGWNQAGGPEKICARHRGRTFVVLFANGQTARIRADEAKKLNWGDSEH